MASKRVPHPHLHRPLPDPYASGAVHPDQYASAIRPPHGGFPHFEMLPPHEVMAHKLSAQHIEIEKLVTENRRLAATHGTLRQDLVTAQHDLQLIHAHIADAKAEKEQQMKGIVDKMSIMDLELEAAEPIKAELQKARAEALSSAATRQELISKAQQLNHDLHKAHSEAQQIPSLMAELDSLRQEYQHCRATYDYEKKLYNDHLESLQVMEQNYTAMSREVEKLRAELTNSANFDTQTGGPYGGSAGYNEAALAGHYASAQNAYAVAQQGQAPLPGGGSGGGAAGAAAGTGGNSPHVVGQSAPYGSSRVGIGYDPQRGPTASSHNNNNNNNNNNNISNNVQRGPVYDGQRGNRPEPQAVQRNPGYGGPSAPVYNRGLGDENQTGANYESQYDPLSRGGGAVGGPPQGQVSANNVPYASTPNNRAGNPVRR